MGYNKRKKIMRKILRSKLDVWAYLVLNFKSPLNHTIRGSFESSWTSENGKNEQKNYVQKMALWRHAAKISEIAIERQKGGSIESSWVKNTGRRSMNI